MDPDRWRRVGDVFRRAIETPTGERTALLEAECADDPELRAQVERLLRQDAGPSEVVDRFDELVAATPGGGPRLALPDVWVGRELGPYRLTSRIATGGMGVVYEATRTDGAFDRTVAIKLVRAEWATEETLRRFELERRALASLDHPNIARLYDGGTTEEGLPYFVMERVHGTSIDRYCDERRLPVNERLQLFATIARAVHFAHQNLVVHRDLKPENILIEEDGTPKLLDFGIARLLDEPDGQDPAGGTRTLARMLTPEYASPEQLAGGAVTTATDVYSLGVVLFRLLTGDRPFHCDSRSPVEWERTVSERAPTRPSSSVAADFPARCATTPARLRHRLSGDLDRIVLMALRKEPERRYDSARELADDVEHHLAGLPVAARGDSLAYRCTTFVRRHRVGVAAAVLVVLALVAGLVAARRGQRRAEAEALHARIEAESLQYVTDFLMSTFLTSELVDDEENRQAARETTLNHAARVRRQYPDEVHLRANLLDALGRVCLRLDLFDDAEALVREALELRVGEFGGESIEVALSLGSLGELQFRRGELEPAERNLREALRLHRSLPVGPHTDVAQAANDLAVTLRKAGSYEESESLHAEALALRRGAVGAETLPVAESLNNLAGLRLDRGEYESAYELLEEALRIRRAILGPEDALAAQSLANLSNAAWNLGRIDAAHELLLEAEVAFRASRDKGRAGLSEVLASLAMIELNGGEAERAEERLLEATELRTELLGPDHPDVASLLVKLALLQRLEQRYDEAHETQQEILRIRRAALPPTSPVLGRSLQEYGVLLFEMRDLAAAEDALREAVEILTESPPANAAVLARAELGLGLCLVVTNRVDEGEELLHVGFERLQSAPGVRPEELEAARQSYLGTLTAVRARRGE